MIMRTMKNENFGESYIFNIKKMIHNMRIL